MSDVAPTVSRSLWGSWVVGLFAFAGGLVLVLPGLGSAGFWSEAELPVLRRTLAALGEPQADLVRSPWLPDMLRTLSYRWLGGLDREFALRLPHAVSVAALAGMASGVARWCGSSPALAWLAGGLVLAFPGNAMAAKTVLGNPVGEAAVTAFILAAVAMAKSRRPVEAVAWGAMGALLLAASVAALGLWLGAALPLFAVATFPSWTNPRLRRYVLAVGLVLAGIAFMLMLRQQEGYVPILGAAKDFDVLERPHTWRFMTGLRQLGEQTFPWLPLAVIGLVDDRRAWAARWWVLGLLAYSGWTLVYGSGHLPLSVPTALCCTAALERLVSPHLPLQARRLGLLVVLLGMPLLGKDADRLPAQTALPLTDLSADPSVVRDLPTERLSQIWHWTLFAVVAGVGLSRMPAIRRHPALGRHLATFGIGAAATYQIVLGHHVMMPRAGDLLSPASMLDRFAQWSAAGELADELELLRVRDPGLEFYGPAPDRRRVLQSRDELVDHLRQPEPTVALIRRADLPFLHLKHRRDRWPLYVLDQSHSRLALVANRLPHDAEDQSVLDSIVVDSPPTLAHETLVRFGDYVELIAWEFDEPVIRGTQGHLTAVFRVLQPLPGGSKLVMRLQKGKVSRVNAEPHVLAEGLYPPMYWRAGDFIVHRHAFEVPLIEILPGTHQVIVALKHGKSNDVEITIPARDRGDFGVTLKNQKRTYATIGTAEVW